MYNFNGKSVVITGAAGGIGRGLVDAFAAWGAEVLALDRDPDALAKLRSSTVRTGVCDLTNLTEVRGAVAEILGADGAVDILVNNAGAAAATALANLTPQAWDHDLAINLTAAYNCVEAVKNQMFTAGFGVILNIGSVNAMLALGHPAYSAAKAGLESYTRSLAVEYGPRGIRVNLIAPGTVKTQAWNERARNDPDIFEKLRKWYPLRDFAEPVDIANACGFLASNQARMITGIVLPVDAGLTAGNPVLAAELTLERF